MAGNYVDVLSDQAKELLGEYCASKKFKPTMAKEVPLMVNIICRQLKKQFEEITVRDAETWSSDFLARVRRGEMSVRTYRTRLICYQGFADFLTELDYFAENPFAMLPVPVVSDAPLTEKIPTSEECASILEAAGEHGKGMDLAVALVLRMALSSRNLCDLKKKDVVSFDDVVYLVIREEGEKKPRYVPVPDDLKEKVARYAADGEGYMFPGPKGRKLERVSLNRRMQQIVKKAGCPQYAIKDLRNRSLFQMLHDGAPVRDVATYAHLTDLRVRTLNRAPIKDAEMLSVCPANTSKMKIVD